MVTDPIETVQLGTTDVRLTPVGAGTWQWGDRLVWGFGNGYDESEIKAAFDAAWAAGITFYDTAEAYGQGRSERFLGKFIRERGVRPVIATKFMPLPWRMRKGSLIAALKKSLDRLGLAQVDLYQIHWPFITHTVEFWADALADAVEAGLVRAVGVSNYSAAETVRTHRELARRGVPLASNQVQYSLLHRDPERNDLLQTCRELGVSVISYSPLAQGMLTGKYTPANPPTGWRGRRNRGDRLASQQRLIDLLREFGQAHGGKTPSQTALNWVVCKGAIPIPGAKNARQAQENAGALGWRLSDDEVAALDEASERFV